MSPKLCNIQDRKPIWIALSTFYLDTELQESDFQYIAQKISESSYSIEEVKAINKHEVFPVLNHNLWKIAGEWIGFDEDWLIKAITSRLKRRLILDGLILKISYWINQKMFVDYWDKLERLLP